ncbi:MAG: hypothetical protein ACYS5V_09790 [Planctomycetota bacterium]|jgi:hypothetical protein
MKAKRRHELKENVLAHELVQIKEFLSRHGTWILIVVAAGAVCWWGYGRYRTSKLNEYIAEKETYRKLTTDPDMKNEDRAKGLAELLDTAKDRVTAAAAGLAAAGIWSQMYVNALAKPEGVPEADVRKYSRNAADLYERVLAAHSDRPRLAARAHSGLAVLEHNMALAALEAGQADKAAKHKEAAKDHYRTVARLLGPDDPDSKISRARIRDVDGLKPIRFATTLPTQPSTATAPATTEPATAPAR